MTEATFKEIKEEIELYFEEAGIDGRFDCLNTKQWAERGEPGVGVGAEFHLTLDGQLKNMWFRGTGEKADEFRATVRQIFKFFGLRVESGTPWSLHAWKIGWRPKFVDGCTLETPFVGARPEPAVIQRRFDVSKVSESARKAKPQPVPLSDAPTIPLEVTGAWNAQGDPIFFKPVWEGQ